MTTIPFSFSQTSSRFSRQSGTNVHFKISLFDSLHDSPFPSFFLFAIPLSSTRCSTRNSLPFATRWPISTRGKHAMFVSPRRYFPSKAFLQSTRPLPILGFILRPVSKLQEELLIIPLNQNHGHNAA